MSSPNLVICMCDELRWCELACYGHPTIRTPHIDALATSGFMFDVAVSNCPVCLPARSSVLAGQYSRTCTGNVVNTGFRTTTGQTFMAQWPPQGRAVLRDATLPELLREAGYRTHAVGKWHIDAWPDAVGFDDYIICANRHAHTAQWFCENGGPLISPSGYSVDYEAERVRELVARDSGQPWFLYYNISPPHMPLADAPERYRTMYDRGDVQVRPNVEPAKDLSASFRTYLWDYRYAQDRLPYTRDLPHEGFDLVDLQALYMGLISWVDDTVGRLIESLRLAGALDNTIIVFTSDHGDNFGSHGLMAKGSLNDEAIRVPMIFRGPGISAQSVSDQVSCLVDLAPTFLDLAGITAPAHMPGQSLVPVLKGERANLTRNHAFVETEKHGIGIRTPGQLLGIPWTDGEAHDQPDQFYDLNVDPYQLNNLAGHAAAKELIAPLASTLLEWDAQTLWGPRP